MEGRNEWKNKWSQGSSPKPNSNGKNTNSMSGLRFRRNQRENAPHSTSPSCRFYQLISTCSLAISTGCPGFHLWFIWDYKPNYSATSWMGGGGTSPSEPASPGFSLLPHTHPKISPERHFLPPVISTAPPLNRYSLKFWMQPNLCRMGRSPPSLWSPITLTHKKIPNQTHQAGSTLWDHKQLKKPNPNKTKH